VAERPAHGFEDDEARRRLLRSRPPQKALDWVGSTLEARVVSARAVRGGISSAMHEIRLESPRGATRQVVLRRYVRPELIEEEPGIAAREARTLEFVESLPVPTPQLLGVDPTGIEAGVPSVIMSRLGGRVHWWPSDTEPSDKEPSDTEPSDMNRWLSGLAELLPVVHDARPPQEGVVPRFAPYAPERYVPPRWSTEDRVWERAFEIFLDPPPAGERVFVHRDFHPGNVLWSRKRVSGLVDWQAACIGRPALDVGHCRANLYQYGLEVADRFSSLWEAVSGRTYDPWTEIVSIVGVMDVFGSRPGKERTDMQKALARAVSDGGG
jgi:aminoglycoside phosphotransferase (APT) family kinase protein